MTLNIINLKPLMRRYSSFRLWMNKGKIPFTSQVAPKLLHLVELIRSFFNFKLSCIAVVIASPLVFTLKALYILDSRYSIVLLDKNNFSAISLLLDPSEIAFKITKSLSANQ